MKAERHLLLLRHAKAVVGQPGQRLDHSHATDHARPLAERGRADAREMGKILHARALLPKRALVSTARRTRETFELLGMPPDDRMTRHFSDELYLAGPEILFETIAAESEGASSLLLVGHNPGLHELAMALSGNSVVLSAGFATCTLAMFAIVGGWEELAAGPARLVEILRPAGRDPQGSVASNPTSP